MLPRMLHCKLLRSTDASCANRADRYGRALAHPGVHLVLTGKDFKVPYGILPVSQDEYPLEPTHVRFVGDPVAAVIARDELTAFEALDLIEVEYEPLRTFSTPEESLEHEEPRIHEYGEPGQHPQSRFSQLRGCGEGVRRADEVFEDTFFYQGSTHLANRAARRGGGQRSRRKTRTLVQHAGSALLAPRARQSARDAGRRIFA